MSLQDYFEPFRKNILGNNHHFNGPFGQKKIIYADWTASGRLYEPLEERLLNDIAPFIDPLARRATLRPAGRKAVARW